MAKKNLSIIEKIFSIRNHTYGKVFNLLGINIKTDFRGRYSLFSRKTKVKNNKIIFMNYLGRPYGCNPKYIAEEIIKRNLPVELVWVTKKISSKNKKSFPNVFKFVEYKNVKKCIKEFSSSKIWVCNYHLNKLFMYGLCKKDEQKYIQTWHGSLGIKKIEKDVPSLIIDDVWLNNAKKNSELTNYWVSNSSFEDNIYKDALWANNGILRFGHPRNDIFFISEQEKNNIKQKVYKSLGVKDEKKIILYVPTFREGTLIDKKFEHYKIDVDKIRQSLSQKNGDDWEVVVRMHPHFKQQHYKYLGFENVICANTYSDIQELLLASDAMITDYSSCIFDFMLSKKPAFVFATDIEKYNTQRGFYYPLETTPFPIATNNEELIKNIENFDLDKYKLEINEFLEEKGCIEDGSASKRVVDLIEKIISEGV